MIGASTTDPKGVDACIIRGSPITKHVNATKRRRNVQIIPKHAKQSTLYLLPQNPTLDQQKWRFIEWIETMDWFA